MWQVIPATFCKGIKFKESNDCHIIINGKYYEDKKIFIFILSGIMIILSSCSGDTEHETKSIADEGLEIKETLKSCDVVSDLEGLPEAKESQEYNYETDYNPSWIVSNGAADANNQIYTNCDVNLIYYY